MSESGEITQLLARWTDGDEAARDRLMTLTYGELRRIARRRMAAERDSHTLQTTALIHEAYLRLSANDEARWENRQQFFCVAARVMRRVLVDHARKRDAEKRGGGEIDLPLADVAERVERASVDLEALDDALRALEGVDPRQSAIVELKFFAGMTLPEIAETMAISPASVKRYWETAKMWLRREMTNNFSQP